MRYFLTVFAAFTLFATSPALSHDDSTDVLDLPKGGTLITLSAMEMVEVDQDLLVANLYFRAEDKNISTVQDSVNKKMKEALDAAEKVDSVKAATQQYHVHEYDRSRSRDGRSDMIWRGQQGLQLKSKESGDLLELVGKLQAMGFAMNGLSYTLSPQKMEDTQNSLLEDTIAKLMAKAERTAKALGKNEVEVLKIDVNPTGGNFHQPVMRAMAMEAASSSMAAPVAAPGESQVSLSVSAQILLTE